MSLPALYKLTGDYKRLLALATDESANHQAIFDTLEAIECSIEEKAQNGIAVIKNLEAYAKTIESEEKRLKGLYETVTARIRRIKEYYRSNLEAADIKKVRASLGTLSIANNAVGTVTIVDSKIVPSKYITVEQIEKIMKDQIKADIEAGANVPGVSYEVKTHLRIS